jgi:hypothetical protein
LLRCDEAVALPATGSERAAAAFAGCSLSGPWGGEADIVVIELGKWTAPADGGKS